MPSDVPACAHMSSSMPPILTHFTAGNVFPLWSLLIQSLWMPLWPLAGRLQWEWHQWSPSSAQSIGSDEWQHIVLCANVCYEAFYFQHDTTLSDEWMRWLQMSLTENIDSENCEWIYVFLKTNICLLVHILSICCPIMQSILRCPWGPFCSIYTSPPVIKTYFWICAAH